ncbi:MAG: hypothetical protein ACTSR2_02510 [Candidatus Hodarchaeales archaeon]
MILRIEWQEFLSIFDIFSMPESPNLWYKETEDKFVFLFFRDTAIICERSKRDLWEENDTIETKEQKLKEFREIYTANALKFISYGGV